MKANIKTFAALLGAVAVAWMAPAAVDADDLILRAPESEIAGIASRNGLEIVAQVDTAPDAEGNSIFRVRIPDTAEPQVIIQDIEQLEPAAVGVERAALASLPETGEGLDLDQRTTAILGSLERAMRLNPPSSVFDSGWAIEPDDRQLPPRASGAVSPKKLKIEMEHAVTSQQAAYSVAVTFSEGCAIELIHDSFEVGAVVFNRKKASWQIINTSSQKIRLDGIQVGWPAANDDLRKIKLDNRILYDDDRQPPSATIDSGWRAEDRPEDREIAAGQAATLTFEFGQDADPQPAAYSLALDHSFATGSGSCRPHAAGHLELEGNVVEWQIWNGGGHEITIDSIALTWPVENGAIQSFRLGSKELFEPVYAPHGKNPDGSDRYLWSAYVNQPASRVLRVAEAQDSASQGGFQGAGIVAIIDSGVDPDHPLFAHRLLPGYDFIRGLAGSASEWDDLLDQQTTAILDQRTTAILGDSGIQPLNPSTTAVLTQAEIDQLDADTVPPAFGHGTMVAGIVHLVAPEAQILPLKAFDGYGHGNLFEVVEAIYYAVDQGVHVINMSFSLESFSPELMRAVNYAARHGVTCVASAGNDGDEVMVYPAALGNTLGVASTSDEDMLSPFSNHGSDLVTVAAPGENLVTGYPGGGWALASGTSFSAPWISGAVALFADKNGTGDEPGRADYYIASEALSHASALQGDGQGRAGHGRADIKTALDELRDGVTMDDSPAVAYSIVVTFAEGCTVEYPPAVNGCSAEVESQLSFHHKRVEWKISNAGDGDLTVDSIQVSWPAENADLRKIKLGGATLDEQDHPPASVTIDSSWLGGSADRQIKAGKTGKIQFTFENNAAES